MIAGPARSFWRRQHVRLLFLALVLPLVNALCAATAQALDYPRDPGGTLEAVERSGTIRAAVSEDPPWSALGDDAPGGVEARLISSFAAELGVTVTWHEMSQLRALDAIERGAIDVAIGGFDRVTVSAHTGVAPSYVYFRERFIVAAARDAPIPEGIDGLVVFAPPDLFLAQALRQRGAIPVETRESSVYEVTPAWQAPLRGFVATDVELYTTEHVIAVPQGENAWLMRLERYLRAREGEVAEMLGELSR